MTSKRPGPEGVDEPPLRLPLAEEELTARVTERDQGVVRIRKHVETVPMRADIDLRQEAVRVDRQPRDEVVDAAREPWYEGDTLVIPRYEERLVTEKRLVLVEEIRVQVRPETERVHLRDSVRREVVDIDGVPDRPGR
jgi:uncharacterized protein (TIGR02271 family)